MTSDGQRFERVYEAHYDAVLRYCLRRSTREDAMDAAADTFVVGWRRSADMPEGHELPWLYAVARNVLSHQRRTAGRRVAATARLGDISPLMVDHVETEVVRHEAVGEMVAAIGRLGDADREVIRLAGWEELERDELGVALGCTPNAATKKLNRALDRLAGELGVSHRAGGRFFTRGVSQ